MADYVKTNWQNAPSTQTPINADNLNHMEQGIYDAQAAADQAQESVDEMDSRVDLVEQRLDNLIPEGTPTEGNAELIDIRAGGNGVNYLTAGDAVRGQYGELKSALTDTNNFVGFNVLGLSVGAINGEDINQAYSNPNTRAHTAVFTAIGKTYFKWNPIYGILLYDQTEEGGETTVIENNYLTESKCKLEGEEDHIYRIVVRTRAGTDVVDIDSVNLIQYSESSIEYRVSDLEKHESDYINALELGFVPNDDTFDNSTIFSKVNSNMRIYFPAGDYYFQNSVAVDKYRVTLKGSVTDNKQSSPINFDANRSGTTFIYDGNENHTFFTFTQSNCLIEDITFYCDSYEMTVDQTKTDIDEFYNVTVSKQNVNCVSMNGGNSTIFRCCINGFSGFGFSSPIQSNYELKSLYILNCGVGIILRGIDSLTKDINITKCGTGIRYTSSVDAHHGLFNSWIDRIKGNAIESTKGLYAEFFGIWCDLCGGSFIYSENYVLGVINGRIHRCNMNDIFNANTSCGNIRAKNQIEINILCDSEANFLLNDISYDQRHLLYSSDNDNIVGFVVTRNNENIAEDITNVFAICGGRLLQ